MQATVEINGPKGWEIVFEQLVTGLKQLNEFVDSLVTEYDVRVTLEQPGRQS